MPPTITELDPVSRITVDAIGQPGQRVFYLQAAKGSQVVTALVEKIQVQTLAEGIDQFLSEIAQNYPERPVPAATFNEADMHVQPPLDPLFRAGDMGLAYNADDDRVCLYVRAILTGDMQEGDADELRLWTTRTEMAALAAWSLELSGRGRAICPQCGEPMDPAGHFCPKKNGHKH